jgi:hypothetical protein
VRRLHGEETNSHICNDRPKALENSYAPTGGTESVRIYI